VTHDQEEAMALADHVVVMNHGRIEDQGSPERVYGRPATRFTATFMGESTIVPAHVEQSGQVRTPFGVFKTQDATRGTEVCVAIRPEHVQLGPGIAATVKDVCYQGSFKRVVASPAAAPDIDLLAQLPADAPVTVGSAVSLQLDSEKLVILKA
jgi:spermidine/putrescine transport system ATP-binding protein